MSEPEEKTGGRGAVRATVITAGLNIQVYRSESSQAVPACPSGKGRLEAS
jgi:hypothetical protein